MERHWCKVFPETGHTTRSHNRFGGAVSVLLFRFDLWLKGDPVRQIRKVFERDDDDEDMLLHSAHRQHARHKAKADLPWAKGDQRSPERGGVHGPSMPWVASPALPSTPPALTPAAAAAKIAKALQAKRGEEPEWKTGWAEWEAQNKRRKESERLQADVDTAPVSPRTPLRMQTTAPCEKRGEKQEDGLPTPPISPPSSRSSSELARSFPWALSPHPAPPLPWASRLYLLPTPGLHEILVACFVDRL